MGKEWLLRVDADKCYLSSESRIYKTDGFIKETRRMSGVDDFLFAIADGIVSSLRNFSFEKNLDTAYLASVGGGEHSFLFRFGCQVLSDLPLLSKDVLFFRYIGKEKNSRTNDQRFIDFLLENRTFLLKISVVKDLFLPEDFKKIYRLSHSDTVNFPLLNTQQKTIVTTEDKNVLVQGVAGSGKTNICIDKIIYSAGRDYAGKVLYSTFSRGLLVDTKTKVNLYKKNLIEFVRYYEEGRVVFCDKNHRGAIENRLGLVFTVDGDKEIIQKIKSIITFLDTQVDYFLLEDIYKKYYDEGKVTDESFFIKEYVGGLKNYRLAGKLERIKDISYEVIYKEIFGMIYGSFDPTKPAPCLTEEEYVEARKKDFGKTEAEVIYSIAVDYGKFLEKEGLVDNNLISRRLLEKVGDVPLYSLAILDEVQDFTQVNLCLLRKIAFRVFCVGDALQMINPSYFNFAYLKRLLFKEDEASVTELKHNYRNTEKIEKIIEGLGKLNLAKFGTHSFVLKGQSVESGVQTAAIYVKDRQFAEKIAKENFDNFTVVCSGAKEKEQLRKILKKQEILTVSEIKGLEREAVLLYNLLSDNADKWSALERNVINRKTADENSVYRYYFNLFYVGVSRAKQYLYVTEREDVPMFRQFFDLQFEKESEEKAIGSLSEVVRKIEVDQEEIIERTEQFIRLGQYDNAGFLADKIEDDALRRAYLNRVDVNREFVKNGNYRDAGIRYWYLGMTTDAKEMFELSGDKALVDLVDAIAQGETSALDAGIVSFYPDLEEDEGARALILRVLENDLARLEETQKDINKKLKKGKGR